jgi:hypothetical protein
VKLLLFKQMMARDCQFVSFCWEDAERREEKMLRGKKGRCGEGGEGKMLGGEKGRC